MSLTRKKVAEYFRDNRWYTAADLAHALHRDRALPGEILLRVRGADRTQDAAEAALYGYEQLLLPVLERMVKDGFLEERRNLAEEAEYRMVVRSRGLKMANPWELQHPANTASGVSQPILYRLLHEHPGVTEDRLIELLAPCWKPEADLKVAWFARSGAHDSKRTKNPNALDDLPPEERQLRMKRGILRMLITRCNKHVKAEIVTRYYLSEELPPEAEAGAGEGGDDAAGEG